jgi:hypothetical protein
MEMRIKACLLLLAGAQFLVSSGCGGNSVSKVTATPPAIHNEWAWMGGSSTIDQPGTYGTLGAPSASNSPGDRMWACSWTDPSGNFWLFGGFGWGSAAEEGIYNDLWEYSGGQWAWMGGSDQPVGIDYPNQPGIYGTMGVPSTANLPGARFSATCWTDPQGNLWLYGGEGFDSTATRGYLGDMWRYSNGQWTWMAGSEIAATPETGTAWQGLPVYGTEGVASPSNTPGARWLASGWADPQGNLWLFSGVDMEQTGTNDLWKYSNGMWTWMAGSNQPNPFGTYGVLGVPAPGNTPGARSGAATWTDAAGNLWLFGGDGNGADASGCAGAGVCVINDLWEYAPSLKEWAWMGGPDEADQPGVYGTEGVAAPGNLPPPRNDATAWTDSKGNLWLFGGGYNDLWKYSSGEWTWENGSNQSCSDVQVPGVYGTLGIPSAANVPGARTGAVGWADKSGNLWLFGGGILCYGSNSSTKLNDLWEYQP